MLRTIRTVLSAAMRSFDNPVLSKECFARLRDDKTLPCVVASPAVLGIIALIYMGVSHNNPYLGGFGTPAYAGKLLFMGLMATQACAILVFLPAYGSMAITGEKEKNTFEFLLLSGLKSWEIVLGKWATIVMLGGLFCVAGIPSVALVFFVGGIDLPLFSLGYVSLFALVCLVSMLTVAASCRYPSTRISILASYAASMGFGMAIWMGLIAGRYRLQHYQRYSSLGAGAPVSHVLSLLAACAVTYYFLAAMAWLFTASSNRLKSGIQNLSTSLRLQFAVYAIVSPILFIALWEAMKGVKMTGSEMMFLYFLGQSLVLVLLGTCFCYEDPLVPRRKELAWLDRCQLRQFRGMLMPGSRSGIQLATRAWFVALVIPFLWLVGRTVNFRRIGAALEIMTCASLCIGLAYGLAFLLSTRIRQWKIRKAVMIGVGFLYFCVIPGLLFVLAEARIPYYDLDDLRSFHLGICLLYRVDHLYTDSYGGVATVLCLALHSGILAVVARLCRSSWNAWRVRHSHELRSNSQPATNN